MNYLKTQIEDLVREYYHQNHEQNKEYQEGERIQYSGRIFDAPMIFSMDICTVPRTGIPAGIRRDSRWSGISGPTCLNRITALPS